MLTFKPDHLTQALEYFAKESARLEQIGQPFPEVADATEDDEDAEWTPGCEEDDGGMEDDNGDDEDDEGSKDDSHHFLATPTFDSLFPPVDYSKKSIPTSVIKRMWRECTQECNADICVHKQKLFYSTLERALNADVKTMLIKPRRLDVVFALT